MPAIDTDHLSKHPKPEKSGQLSRRTFLKNTSQTIAFISIATHLLPASAIVEKDSIRFYCLRFENWAKNIVADHLMAVSITSEADAIAVTQWAMEQDYQVRPLGSMHNWSPLVITANTPEDSKVLLVDLSAMAACHMDISESDYGVVAAQPGIKMEALCQYLAEQPSPRNDPSGYALASLPAIGHITLGGALAIGGHGTGVPVFPDDPKCAFGTLSNLVLSIRAVVWDRASGSYQVRTFDRNDEDIDVVLAHLGHLLVTGVRLQVVPNFYLRCRSFTNIHWEKMFHNNPQDNPFTVQRLLERHGRVNVIWFPYTDKPWLKIWDKDSQKPDDSLVTTTPYNYAFADEPSDFLALLIKNIVSFTSRLIPYASKLQYLVVARGLKKPIRDLWGPAWHTLLYVRPTTLPAAAAGYVIHLPRSEVQAFLSEAAKKIYQLREQYAREGIYISCGPLEIRITGLDETEGLKGVQPGINPPALSPLTRSAAYSETVDTAVWLDLLTLPSTITAKARGRANAFDVDLENWLFERYPAAQVRVEWSKGWAYTAEEGAWHNREFIGKKIPESFSGTPRSFEQTVEKIRAFDPHNLFSNGFLDKLFQYTRPE